MTYTRIPLRSESSLAPIRIAGMSAIGPKRISAGVMPGRSGVLRLSWEDDFYQAWGRK